MGALFFVAGMRMIWVLGLAGAAGGGLFGAYFGAHVAGRIKRFMNPRRRYLQGRYRFGGLHNGGWSARPVKASPSAACRTNTDFVFGGGGVRDHPCPALPRCSPIVIRALSRAYATEDMFARFAASGLAILFGVQAAINMSVNLQLIPAKGMTLPFISYGGSSIISLAYGVGMMLALTRQRPRTEMDSIGDPNAARNYA